MKSFRSISILVLALCTMPAFATHPEPTPPQEQAQGQQQENTSVVETVVAPTNIVQNSTTNALVDESDRSMNQGQAQRASSDQAQSQSANNTGNAQAVTLSQVYKQVRQTASAHADAGNATISCGKDRRAGIQLPGIGFSAGGTATDRDCKLLRAAEMELSIGNELASIRLRCATKLYQKVFDERTCLSLLDTQTVSRDYATKQEVSDAVSKAFKAAQTK